VFESIGAKISAVPVDDEGMLIPDASVRGARIAYVTPAHQFPLGITMSLRRRLELLDWARSTGTLIFEDDYDSEFRFSGRPVPALQGLDRSGQVLLAGSFASAVPVAADGLLVVPPPWSISSRAKSSTTRHAPLIEGGSVRFHRRGAFAPPEADARVCGAGLPPPGRGSRGCSRSRTSSGAADRGVAAGSMRCRRRRRDART
jgi:GntR family transcriptional regulator/MocR family aminotransferase